MSNTVENPAGSRGCGVRDAGRLFLSGLRSPEFSARCSGRIQQEQQKSAQIETPDVAESKASHPQNKSEYAQHLAQGVQEQIACSPADHHGRAHETDRNKREGVEQSIRRIVSEFPG